MNKLNGNGTSTISETSPNKIVMTLKAYGSQVQKSENNAIQIKISPPQQVKDLIGTVAQKIKTLPPEYQDEVSMQINSWAKKFFSTGFIDSNKDIDREKAAHQLLFLNGYIDSVMVSYVAKSDLEQVKWLVLSNNIISIVKEILPKQVDAKKFIVDDRNKQLEIQLRYNISLDIADIIKLIKIYFDELEDKIYEEADSILNGIQEKVEQVKSGLIKLNDFHKISTVNLHKYADELTGTVISNYNQLEEQKQETENLGKKISSTDAVLHQLMNELESLLNKI